jgi:S-(hydroxymethyl)glutathione dehydrogenase/alcohol dehydrogenase
VIERGGLVDYAFEAIGLPRTIELTTQLIRPGGEAILVGMAPPDARVSYNPLDMTLGEKAIRGCWYGSCRPPIDFPILLDLYKAGKLRLDLLVTPCTLDEVNDAMTAIENGKTARSVIVF